MKKVGVCEKCNRQVYTNRLNLCKRCHTIMHIETPLEPEQLLEEQQKDIDANF